MPFYKLFATITILCPCPQQSQNPHFLPHSTITTITPISPCQRKFPKDSILNSRSQFLDLVVFKLLESSSSYSIFSPSLCPVEHTLLLSLDLVRDLSGSALQLQLAFQFQQLFLSSSRQRSSLFQFVTIAGELIPALRPVLVTNYFLNENFSREVYIIKISRCYSLLLFAKK